ncbi:hypothetical protein MARBORIA2_16870 [Methanobrevibacter arboriphilus]|jgi:hypothetical protein|uniref:Uncharacterized protein n=1 Tax=Methanobrevibacter arboriphilus TaxID=39441 RepID=A0ACA8R148_METAZ|nr:hypothetical protein [Methanobrevibacter arboriphilus]MCC7562796.1 hypothetical protein [Methanobrevibacter arboriphilus]BBL61077.1 hypothetical protein MarbSA_01170 [Methanobrevibacter arboriphilus]GLI12597.1 hypothetical protein MARBORIA2_16870 [Methanobrevibacter arboriphilus]
MAILLTNISENILNENIIKESFTKLKNKDELINEEITEIFYLNEKISEQNGIFDNIKVNKFEIDINKDMDEVYNDINQIIEDILDKKQFIDVIVDTSFLAYLILEVLIKNFKITDVFMLENNKLTKAHPCGCEPEYKGY